jgi:phosphoribosylanthranilate isomerase
VAVLVKVCGVTRPSDAQAVVDAGADAIGLMFADSPRKIDIGLATELAVIAASICRVAVFMNNTHAQITAVLEAVDVDLLQFHGDENSHACNRYGLPYWKSVRVQGEVDVADLERRYEDAEAFLFDSYTPGVGGGSGQTFDWGYMPESKHKLILAGGLSPSNVAEAIAQTRPHGVDVSSGVESKKGIKDPVLINTFVKEAKHAG